MDDQKIKKNYPLSWELFLRYSGLKKAWHPFDDPKWYRQLFDFFDQNEITVEIGVDYTMEPKFCYKISEYVDGEWNLLTDIYKAEWSDLYLRRPEAEQDAFERAFEVFEKILNEPEGNE